MSTGLREAAEALRDWPRTVLPQLGTALLAEATGHLAAANAALSPVGDPPMDPHPGKLRASWRASAGSAQTANLADAPSYPAARGRAEFVPPLRSALRPGQAAHVTNDARSDRSGHPYAYGVAVLGRGVLADGRAVGSLKAPEGTVKPSMADLAAHWREVAARALAHVFGRRK